MNQGPCVSNANFDYVLVPTAYSLFGPRVTQNFLPDPAKKIGLSLMDPANPKSHRVRHQLVCLTISNILQIHLKRVLLGNLL